MVALEVGMVVCLEYLRAALGQRYSRDEAGVFDVAEQGVAADDFGDRPP
jgi:hypothetical protein